MPISSLTNGVLNSYERYKKSMLKEIASFANGLEKDISAVENAVASPLSNGFVEGTNSKVKMVKRTMYGRCSQKLLAAKLMYEPT
ncbi:transposase [Hespellia stercorisuis]|uniref:transposase n=1 Tax=Hespellia stercorisuis TaxID=180311 RepID=UPI0038BA338C